jgi:hypothetical protein
MDDRYDMECCGRRFYHQAVDDRDADCAEPGFVSEAEANLKGPITDHGTEGSKGDLGVVRYPIIARQLANARAVDGRDRRKIAQIHRFSKALRARPSRLFPLLSHSLGFTHRIAPQI